MQTNDDIQRLGETLLSHNLTIATAESCTAGGIGAAIASIDGASRYYVGGVITYATELKTRILGVPPEVIDEFGVVSKQTAVAMNGGVRTLTGADVAVSITGYAGSNGGDEFAENGTVWICVSVLEHEPVAYCIHVDGGRSENLKKAISEAIRLCLNLILDVVDDKAT